MPSDQLQDFRSRVGRHLTDLYGYHAGDELIDGVLAAAGIGADLAELPVARPAADFSEDEVVLITYGDSVSGFSPALHGLTWLLDEHLDDVFSTVHILPFFPSSSDGGFSVADYYGVADDLGGWSDIGRVAGVAGRRLMADLIVNHGSAQSEWFRQFRDGEAPGRSFWKTAEPTDDLSDVVRPRTHDLLQPVDTASGVQHVWCTFSHDQIDFDFANPEVLLEFIRITNHLVSHGVRRIRLDAIAYLWKEVGTPCIHNPQTHAYVRLMRTLLEVREPDALIITETNVPHEENVSYFGSGDEAHVVYNFSLVPLVLHAVLAGDAEPFVRWARALELPGPDASYLNFLASHDGLGVRPAEGLLTQDQLEALVVAAESVGGTWSPYQAADGERPYELNVGLADLLGGPGFGEPGRFVAAHAIALAFAGIPAVYVHSILASAGEPDRAAQSGIKRDVNRGTIAPHHIAALAAGDLGTRSAAFAELGHMIRVRRGQPAFSPTADQEVLDVAQRVVALLRTARVPDSGRAGQQVLALTNVTGDDQTIRLDLMVEGWVDLLDPDARPLVSVNNQHAELRLDPWQTLWLTPAAGQ